MLVEWDECKDIANRKKHGLDFDSTTGVFMDPLSLSKLDERFSDEERFVITGESNGLLIVVVYTFRESNDGEEIIRIISARKASPQEARRYQTNR